MSSNKKKKERNFTERTCDEHDIARDRAIVCVCRKDCTFMYEEIYRYNATWFNCCRLEAVTKGDKLEDCSFFFLV